MQETTSNNHSLKISIYTDLSQLRYVFLTSLILWLIASFYIQNKLMVNTVFIGLTFFTILSLVIPKKLNQQTFEFRDDVFKSNKQTVNLDDITNIYYVTQNYCDHTNYILLAQTQSSEVLELMNIDESINELFYKLKNKLPKVEFKTISWHKQIRSYAEIIKS